ncbi:hypothetical protein PMAYCL1PPCAC_20596 [Pristionchus mayeri]|uniref:Uncharacterized protein n=1 Tax=Pristionchus mayeri TaxID=1317129 RepID=A0AAN5I4D8_9BILA|nr:hypothetical protein PMAYCL1PPCAC_20596 [Pristionchus mayeri]
MARTNSCSIWCLEALQQPLRCLPSASVLSSPPVWPHYWMLTSPPSSRKSIASTTASSLPASPVTPHRRLSTSHSMRNTRITTSCGQERELR